MKRTTKAKVAKSLTPEEQAILGNIRSLLEELDSTSGADDMDAPAMEEETVIEESDDPTEEESVNDPMEEDSTDVEKANEPDETSLTAEERLTVEDTDVDNALEVLKSYIAKRGVKKSKNSTDARLARVEKALGTIIEGMGVVNSVRRPQPVQKSSQSLVTQLAREIAKVEKSAKQDENLGLRDAMSMLFK